MTQDYRAIFERERIDRDIQDLARTRYNLEKIIHPVCASYKSNSR